MKVENILKVGTFIMPIVVCGFIAHMLSSSAIRLYGPVEISINGPTKTDVSGTLIYCVTCLGLLGGCAIADRY